MPELLSRARVGWVEAIAETHHNPRPPDDGFRFALPILQRLKFVDRGRPKPENDSSESSREDLMALITGICKAYDAVVAQSSKLALHNSDLDQLCKTLVR